MALSRGSYGVYVAITRSTWLLRGVRGNHPVALTGQLYVKGHRGINHYFVVGSMTKPTLVAYNHGACSRDIVIANLPKRSWSLRFPDSRRDKTAFMDHIICQVLRMKL